MPIRFILQSKRNPAYIYVRMSIGRNIDIKANTNLLINPVDWSEAKEQPKFKNETALKDELLKVENYKLIDLNKKLIEINKNLTAHYNNRKPNDIINTQWLKDFINPPKPVEVLPFEIKSKELINYFEYYINIKKTEILKDEIKPSTIKKLIVIKKLLERYQKESKTTILIKDIDNDFKLRFEKYCLKYGYAPNTIARAIKYIKTVCRHARINGIDVNIQLDNIKLKLQKVEHVYLTFEELEQIQKKDFKNKEHLDNARDWLIISCYAGQRVSDFMKFDKNQIRIENGKYLIEFTQVKTNKIMTLPLHKKILEILEKRNGDFPRAISDQKYNDYIKDVCKLTELTQKVKGSRINPETIRKETGIYEKWQLVSSHIGRRSFATNHFGIIPTSLLIAATGHSTETMFLAYIGKTDTQKAQQLADYF